MAKSVLPYKVNNRLAEYIQSRAELTNQYMQDIENDLGLYCGLTVNKEGRCEAIKKIKQGDNEPRGSVMLKIAEYFRVKVEDIFSLSE